MEKEFEFVYGLGLGLGLIPNQVKVVVDSLAVIVNLFNQSFIGWFFTHIYTHFANIPYINHNGNFIRIQRRLPYKNIGKESYTLTLLTVWQSNYALIVGWRLKNWAFFLDNFYILWWYKSAFKIIQFRKTLLSCYSFSIS